MSTEFRHSGWFAVDAQAEQTVLAFTARQNHDEHLAEIDRKRCDRSHDAIEDTVELSK